MDNPRPEKVAVVAEVRDKFDGAEAVVLTEYRGLGVTQMAELRKALREAGGEYKVYKNTMVRFAVKELDLEIEELLVGPTAIAFTGTRPDGTPGDAVTVAKALTEFGENNANLIIKGGLLEGQPLTVEEITALSKIAPREELLSRLAGGMAAPMQQFAALLKALPQNLAYALAALIEKGGAPGAPESAPVTDEAEASTEEEADESSEAPAEANADTGSGEASEETAEGSEDAAEGSEDTESAEGSEDTGEASEDAAEGSEDTESGEASEDKES